MNPSKNADMSNEKKVFDLKQSCIKYV